MQELERLDKNIRVAIYGIGEFATIIKNYLQNNRPDIKIVCFFDKEERSDIDAIKVLPINKIKTLAKEIDKVIIASHSNKFLMEVILKYYGFENYIFIESFQELLLPKLPEDPRMNDVLSLLSSDKSKDLFKSIVKARYGIYQVYELGKIIADKNSENNLNNIQYLDFIKTDKIKTMISGGAYDGATSLIFNEKLENIEKIYAFEPLYENFKSQILDELIKNSKSIEMISKGLMDKTTEIKFLESGVGSKVDTDEGIIIQTISIDEFVAQRNIEKLDFIKLDVEGCEISTLKGAEKTIKHDRPQLAICIYHSYDDLFDIPLLINSMVSNYTYDVYHYSLNSTYETIFYAIPNELLTRAR